MNEVGSQIQAVGDIALKAGGDINIRAANVQAGGALMAQAGNDIHIVAGATTATMDEGHQCTDKGFLHSELVTTRATLASAGAVGSSLGGATVALGAGRDIGVLGSAVVGDGATTLAAGRNVTIAAATETLGTTSHESVKESGFLSGGGFGISYGERTTTTDQDHDATTQSGQARSTVGSTGGDLTVKAGNALHVSGGDLAAGRDMALAGKSVTIDPGQDDSHGLFKTKTTQDGFTLAVGGSVVAAIQAGQAMGAASKGKDTRVKALAAATAAMAAANAAKDLAANGVSVKISLTAGHSESEQTQVTADSSHSGSTLAAGNNLSISASGAARTATSILSAATVGKPRWVRIAPACLLI
ncbi:hypothetical protein AAKU55_001593 [Oxalobacteraceae bacterium GrIS 1.11]